jgi:squalene-hopene/tetraprenyl-beta-curcumene cyclase
MANSRNFLFFEKSDSEAFALHPRRQISLDAIASDDNHNSGTNLYNSMNRSTFLRMMLGAGALGAATRDVHAQVLKLSQSVNPPPPAQDRSLQLEIEHAIDRGIYSLQAKQNPDGYWSTPVTPGLSALVLTALVNEPTGLIKANPPDFVKKGYDYLLKCQQPDGGIYLKGLANYSTSVCTMALLAAGSAAYEPILKRARMFLISLQGDYPQGSEGEAYNGGVGYDKQDAPLKDGNSPTQPAAKAVAATPTTPVPAGPSPLHYDLSNTSFAMEALRETQHLADSNVDGARDLNWSAAVGFLERCQHLPQYNKAGWVKDDSKNRGGFVYEPENKKGLLAYGSMSYAGLLSYIHADLKKDDPRVMAVLDWLRLNFTLEENPGMGADGLYYYYQMMAKALASHGTETLTMADGKQVAWASELALKLINLQSEDGSWVNSSGRWWEKDPTLVTAYAVLTLEGLHSRV